MDLVVVADTWDEDGGGRERYVAELVAYLTRRGVAVRVVCRHARRVDGNVADRLTVCGGGVRGERAVAAAVRAAAGPDGRTPVLAVRPTRGATHYQLHSGIQREAFAAERESLRSAARRRLYGLGLRIHPRRQRLLRAEAALLGDPMGPRLMVFSRALAQTLAARHRVAPDRIRASVLGVDLDRFHPPGARDPSGRRRPAVLFAGHNYTLKGLPQLLASLARLGGDRSRPTLTVVGRGPVERYRRRAAAAGIGGDVTFAGDVTQDRLAALYRDHDALVLPTFYDPCPRVVLEALASGCPVVTTRQCGASELIVSGAHGFVIAHPEDPALDDALGAVCGSAEARQTLRRQAAAVGRRLGFARHAAEVCAWLGIA